MKKETLEKIRACKALQGVAVSDFLSSERFLENLAAYVTAQREDRKAIKSSYEAMRKVGGAKGYKLPAHTIDRLMNLSVSEFSEEVGKVFDRTSQRPFAEREYLYQLGRQAYNLTVAQIVCEEFPELKDELLPKTS